MWFGTVDGLNRYDGYEVTVFNIDKGNPNSISNNTIRCLAEDEFGRIWIGTDDGLCVYDSKLEKIRQIPLEGFDEERLTVNTALVLGEKLYVGTSRGLFIVDIETRELGKIDTRVSRVDRANDSGTYQIVACKPGKGKGRTIWFATKMSLYQLFPTSGNTPPALTIVSELEKRLPDIRNLEEDNSGNLWIVSHDNGFARYKPETGELQHFKKDMPNASISTNKVSSAVIDKTGNLWIGTHDSGLFFLEETLLNDEQPMFQKIANDPDMDRSLSSNLIYSLFVSKNNLLWIGTIGSGIDIYNPARKPFKYFNLHGAGGKSSSSTNFIRSVYADADDNIWIGTHNNGLFFQDRGGAEQVAKIGFGTESVFHMNDALAGNILVCSGQGVSLVKRINGRLVVKSSVPIGPTFCTTKVEDGVFWTATLNGVKQCRLVNDEIIVEQELNKETKPAMSFNNCRVLVYSKKTQELFIGTEGGGLNVLQLGEDLTPKGNTVYMKEDSTNAFSNNYIRSIVRTSDTDLWIGTYEGLNKMTVDPASGEVSFKSYTKKDGLPNNTIQSIIEDKQKNLWVGTNQGLCKFDPVTEVFSQYTLNDGIQSNEFSEHAIFRKSDGEIIIGGGERNQYLLPRADSFGRLSAQHNAD